ncbi:MAG: hypothetical protein JST19_18795 [Bacteroidetes bacterium]|nr:hypothetical protein [Bacteroidota bacterium]
MNEVLNRLGISPEIQAFFGLSTKLIFYYGDDVEEFSEAFHRVPTTRNLWVAGAELANHIVITYSAMEAIAFISTNRHRYQKLEQLAFVAIGNKLQAEQIDWIRNTYPGRKLTLVFGRQVIDQITAIKLAAGIKNFAIRVYFENNKVIIRHHAEQRVFDADRLSLHEFQEAFGLRPRLNTGKPIKALTFLDQLKTNL